MADYSGSFFGSFQGTISGSLLGSGIVSSSTQIDFNNIANKPTTIQPFQANSITSNNNFRQVTFPAVSASVSTRITATKTDVDTLSTQTTAVSASNSTRLTNVEGYTLDNVTDNGSSTTNVITVGGLTVNGNATITGTLTAQQFNTEFVSSSIIFESGSTKFGDSVDDIHSFTGSVKLNTQTAATTDTDKFLVFDTGGEIKYRTGAEVLSDINPGGLISSSAQIAGEISGAFTAASGGFSTRITTLTSDVSTLQTQIQAVVAGSGSADWNLITNIPAGLVSSSTQISEFGYILSSQTSSFVLSSQTSSMSVLNSLTASFISDVFISESVLRSGFGSGTTTDISALNTFTGSAQTNLNALNSATSSYLTSANTSSFILVSQTSSMSVLSALTASFISSTFISASVVASGFGSGGGLTISGSTPSGDQINKVFSNLQFDSSTGLNVTESISGTAFVSIGSHFRDIIVNGSATLVATGSDSLEIIAGDGIQIFTSLFDTNADGISKELEFRLDTSSVHFTDGVKTKLNTDGVISSSAQLTTEFDTRYLNTSGDGVISSSAQLTTEFDTRYLNTTGDGVISSSAQIAGEISGAFTELSGGLAGRITTLEGTSGDSVIALNLFTSSIQTQVNNLTAETSSYLTSADTSSFVLNSETASFIVVSQTSSMSVLSALTASFISDIFISASAVRSGFGSGTTTDISALNTFTGSIQTQVNNLNSATSSFVTNSQTSSMSVLSALTASFVGNLNYDYITNLPNLISSSAQIALLGAGILSASAQIAGEISGAFTSLSSSFASRITTLEGAGGGSGIFTLTGSFYSTTNNIQITGSLSVGSGSFKSFEVNSDGFVVLGDMNKDLNNAPEGTIAYSGSSFYLIS